MPMHLDADPAFKATSDWTIFRCRVPVCFDQRGNYVFDNSAQMVCTYLFPCGRGMRSQSEGKWIFSLWQMKRIRMAPSVEKTRPAG